MKKNIVKLLLLAVALMSVLLAFASCGCSHEEEVLPAKAATCTENGLTEGKKCKLCGEILVEQDSTEKLPHAYMATAKQEPTCTEDGHEAGESCIVCGAINFGCETLPAAHKTVDIPAVAATCEKAGATAGKRCTVCLEDVEGFEEIPKLPHDLADVEEIAANCVVDGTKAGKKCRNCDYSEGLEAIPATGHTPEQVGKVEPTCTEDGHEAGVACKTCNAPIDGCTTIPKLGHTINNNTVNITKEPDLGIAGEGTATCDVCKQTVSLELPAKLGGKWDYTSDTDTLYVSKSGTGYVNELVTDPETGKTYVKVGIVNPGVHPFSPNVSADDPVAVAGEANFVWNPPMELGELNFGTKFIFTTDIQIASLVPKWIPKGVQYDNPNGPDKFYDGWLCNPSISTNPSDSNTGDNYNCHSMLHPVMPDSQTSNEIAGIQIGTSGVQIPYKEWFNLKIVFQLDEADASKYTVTYYVNGELVHIYGGTLKANVLGSPILDFRIKFKNSRCYDEFLFYFDNTTFAQEERTAPTVYTYEDDYIASKASSSVVDGATLEVVKDEGKNVLHLTGTSGEAYAFWKFDDLTKLAVGNYFKISTKMKFGNITGANGYANNWIANLGITDAVDNRDDYSRLGMNLNFKTEGDGTVVFFNGGDKYTFTKDMWVTVELWFYLDADGNWHEIVTVDGNYFGESTGKLSDKTNWNENVKGIGFKTKNLTNFSEYHVYFDDTRLTQGTICEDTLPTPPAPPAQDSEDAA